MTNVIAFLLAITKHVMRIEGLKVSCHHFQEQNIIKNPLEGT